MTSSPPGGRHPESGENRIDVVSAAQVPDCPTCGGEGLLSARVPHGLDRADGQRSNGTTVVVLCPRCDAEHPAAGPLITFFHVHGQVDQATVNQCADLLHTWVTAISPSAADAEAIDREADQWNRGEL